MGGDSESKNLQGWWGKNGGIEKSLGLGGKKQKRNFLGQEGGKEGEAGGDRENGGGRHYEGEPSNYKVQNGATGKFDLLQRGKGVRLHRIVLRTLGVSSKNLKVLSKPKKQ